MSRSQLGWGSLVALQLSLFVGRAVEGQDGFDLPPIRYSASISNDPVSILQRKLASGEVRLNRDPAHGERVCG